MSLHSVADTVLYQPAMDPVLIDVPPFEFVMLDGSGDPSGSEALAQAITGVYAFSYPVVIALNRGGAHFDVRPLEALWWADDVAVFDPSTLDRDRWHWRVMIRQPADIPADVIEAAHKSMRNKAGSELAERARLETFAEGLCVQLMHIGPYSTEGPRIAAMHQFVAAQGLRLRGTHHEIYLSDPRRSRPERMRTILRHPVRV
jgi:hypothetical protein